MAGSQTGGRLLHWCRNEYPAHEEDEARTSGRDVYAVILESHSPEPSPLIVLPHLTGSDTIRRLMVVGGGAGSDKVLQIKADIMGRHLCRPDTSDGFRLGAALLAGLATGVYSDLDDVKKLVERDAVMFTPDPGHHRIYERRLAA